MKARNVQTLAEAIGVQAKQMGHKTAMVFQDQPLTYEQFDLNSNKVANGLVQENIAPTTRVAFLAKDGLFGYEILFGCAKTRAVFLPINWRLAAREILFIINDSDAEVLFVGEEFFPIVESIQNDLTTIRKIITVKGQHAEWDNYSDWLGAQAATTPDIKAVAEDVVVQMYTSGTTGLPKGVQLANFSFFRMIQHMKSIGDGWMNLNEEDTISLALPIFHIGGLWWTVQGVVAGCRGILIETFNAAEVLSQVNKYRITQLIMVPAMLQFSLLDPSCKTTDFSSVKGFAYGGSPIAPNLLRKAMELLDCNFFQLYGMTETGNMAVCLRPEDHTLEWNDRMKAAGRPVPGVEAKAIDLDGNILPPNQVGEICLKSPSNMLGYWKREKATEESLKDGWMHTGDAGYIDEEGYIFICDRIKDMIIYADENIYPAEIEAAVNEHEAVVDAAIIGIPDEKWGEVVKAFIVLKDGASLKKMELVKFLRGRIAEFKIPKSVSFVETLPRNPSGKILKRILRAPFWEGRERLVN